MKNLAVQITLSALSMVLSLGSIENFEGEFHTKLMRDGWTRCLSEMDQYSAEEKQIVLGKALLAFSGDIPPRLPERQRNFDTAQTGMLAIPGYAKYYQDQIEKAREFVKYYEALSKEEQTKLQEQSREEEARRNTPVGGLTDRLRYGQVCYDAFEILALLPSPESVAVLGHYLEDPEGRDGKDLLGNPIYVPGSDVEPALPNCGRACLALGRLGIEHPPIQGINFEDRSKYHERVDIWKQWWSEIKSGKRTYRFIGSNIEYGPDGPATPEQIEKARQNRERDEKRAAGHDRRTGNEVSSEKALETKKQSSPLSIGIAALVLLVSILWYFRRVKAAR